MGRDILDTLVVASLDEDEIRVGTGHSGPLTHSFTHAFISHILSTFHGPGTLPASEDATTTQD